jgi:DNA-binding GntR family transcriptional regulator
MSSASLEPVAQRPSSLTEIAFERIRAAIMSKALAPGTRVSESMLSEMLQVSKTPVREALLRLDHIGLVEQTQRGLRVVLPNPDSIRDVYELRSVLEAGSVRDASVRATDEQRAAIVEAAERSFAAAKSEDAAGFSSWDLVFHNAIADAAGNQLLAKAIDESLVLAFALRQRDSLTIDDSVFCSQEHIAIATHIAKGEAAEAGELMSAHIVGAMRLVLETGLD